MTDGVTLVRLHSLGDVVLAQPCATALAALGPVRFATSGEYVPVVARMPGGVVPFAVPRAARQRTLSGLLRDPSAGRVIDLQGGLRTVAAMFPGRPSARFVTDRRARRRVLSGTGSMPYRADDFAAVAGLGAQGPPVLARRSMPSPGVRRIGIVLGGRWPMKSIPEGVAAETARLLHDLYGAEVVLLGAAADRGSAAAVSGAMMGRPHVDRVGSGGVEGLLSDIESLSGLVSPDSGPAHLAAALGVPLLVVFTSTSPALGFWPEGYPGACAADGISCRPCHRHGGRSCRTGGAECRGGLVPRSMADGIAEQAGLGAVT